MRIIRLRHRNHSVLFEGLYSSHQDCIEDALTQGYCLDHADFSQLDLRNINLDGAQLKNVSFYGTNLTGANISEACLSDCDFTQASLFNTCLCFSTLQNCDFSEAECGGTDFSMAEILGCLFSGPSILRVNLDAALISHGNIYECGGKRCSMTAPPIIVQGLGRPIAIFDQDVVMHNAVYTYAALPETNPNVSRFPAMASLSPSLRSLITCLHRLKEEQNSNLPANRKSTKS